MRGEMTALRASVLVESRVTWLLIQERIHIIIGIKNVIFLPVLAQFVAGYS